MEESRGRQRARRLIRAAALLLGLWLAVKYLLGPALPFLLSLALAKLLEPAVERLSRRLGLRRGFVSAVCCLAVTGALLAAAALASGRLLRELGAFARALPGMLAGSGGLLSRLRGMVTRYIVAAPPEVQDALNAAVSGLTRRLGQVPGELMGRVMSLAPELLSHAPAIALSVVTFFISLFFISASYPRITAFLARQVPPDKRGAVREIRSGVADVLGKWLRAECLLCALTFAELCAAFLLLRIDYAVLLALVTALIDMLPVLGTGTVLIPWAAAKLILGDPLRAALLMVTYGVVTLVRSIAEPKLVGGQVGLPAAATLAAMYAGFRTVGVAGMVIFPLALMALKHLNARGFVKLWR